MIDYSNPARPKVRWLADMPTFQLRDRTHLDLEKLAFEVDLRAPDIEFAVVEDVGAMTYIDGGGIRRGQGAAASFAFGKAAGSILGVLAASMIPVYPMKPAVWKILLGLSSQKNDSRKRATELFPEIKDQFARKKDDGRAEATLLAVLGKERFWNAQAHAHAV